MNHANLPDNPDLAGKLIDAERAAEKARLDRGIIGVIFGTKDHVPNNVAALVALLSILLLIALLSLGSDTATLPKKDAMAGILSLITLSLGFLFGRATKD
jgi:hypothetical protein